MNRKIVITGDQSPTLYVPELDEYYHSIHGALQESQHIFIGAGLQEFRSFKELHILEIGFGTGLNALLTLLEAEAHQQKIRYTTIEKYPVSVAEIEHLDYASQLQNNRAGQLLKKLHLSRWDKWQEITPLFRVFKQQVDLRSYSSTDTFHLIYFDAFAPSAQPELWTTEVFEALFKSMKAGGILVTYCVKGDVRRNMKSAGFEVEKIPGPPGKREMARARKPE